MPRRLLIIISAAFLATALACTSQKKPVYKEGEDPDAAPTDVDAATGLPKRNQPAPAPSRASAERTPQPEPEVKTKAPDLIVTIVYVCEIYTNRKRPGAIIYTSDPDCAYLNEKPRASRILKPLYPDADDPESMKRGPWKMKRLLDDLSKAGVDRLPREDQKADDPIDGQRQIILIRDGKRVVFRREAVKLDAKLYETYANVEKVLVYYSKGDDTFVETEGLGPIPGHTPSPTPGR